jgi:hypothetical protein
VATSDEKFLAISTASSICIFALDGFKLVRALKSALALVHKVVFAKTPKGEKDGYVLACHSQKDLSGRKSEVQVWFLDEECKEKEHSNQKGEKNPRGWKVEGKFATFAPTAFSQDSKTLPYLSTVHDKWGAHARVTAVNLETGNEEFHMQGHTAPIMWAGLSPDDRLIATTAWDVTASFTMRKRGSMSGIMVRQEGRTGLATSQLIRTTWQ